MTALRHIRGARAGLGMGALFTGDCPASSRARTFSFRPEPVLRTRHSGCIIRLTSWS